MKHPVRDRILILVNALLLMAIAAVLVLTTLNIIPGDFFTRALAFVQGGLIQKLVVWAGAAVMALFALFLLGVILPGRSRKGQPFAVISSEGGAVNVSVKALEGLVHKCLCAHPELHIGSSSIFSEGQSVRITLHITLLEDISMPLAVSALQKEIRQYVQSCAGVEIDDVRVFIDGTVAADGQVTSPYRVAGTIGAVASNMQPPPKAEYDETPEKEQETATKAVEVDTPEIEDGDVLKSGDSESSENMEEKETQPADEPAVSDEADADMQTQAGVQDDPAANQRDAAPSL